MQDQNMGLQQIQEMVDQLIDLRKKYYQTDKYENYQIDLIQKANLYYKLKKNKEAEKLYQQIIDETPEEQDSDIFIKCEAMVEIARIDEEKYTADKKLEIAEKVQKLLQKTQMGPQSEYQAMVYKFESEIYLQMGQQQKSLDCLEKCCDVYDQMIQISQNEDEQIELMIRQSYIYEQLGNFHIDLRNFEIGLDFLLKAKQRWEYIDPEEENLPHIYLISNIGIGYTTQGDMKQGMPYLNKAKEKLQPVTQENVQMFVFTCQHMAKLRLNLDQIEESLKITQECWEYMQKFQVSKDMEVQILEHFANLSMHQDNYQEAVDYLDKGFEIVEKYSYQKLPITLRMLYLKGVVHLHFKEFHKVQECGEKLKVIAEEIFGYDDEQVSDGLCLIGEAQYYLGQKENNQQMKILGINNLKESIKIIEHNPSKLGDAEKILVELCQIYQYEKQYRESIIQAERLRRVKFAIIEQNYTNSNDIQFLQEDVDLQIEQYIESIKKLQQEYQEKGK